MSILILLLVVLIVVLGVADIRRNLITKPVFGLFKKILPPLSDTCLLYTSDAADE